MFTVFTESWTAVYDNTACYNTMLVFYLGFVDKCRLSSSFRDRRFPYLAPVHQCLALNDKYKHQKLSELNPEIKLAGLGPTIDLFLILTVEHNLLRN